MVIKEEKQKKKRFPERGAIPLKVGLVSYILVTHFPLLDN